MNSSSAGAMNPMIERTFSWFGRNCRIAKDSEYLGLTLAGVHHVFLALRIKLMSVNAPITSADCCTKREVIRIVPSPTALSHSSVFLSVRARALLPPYPSMPSPTFGLSSIRGPS
jgi:hypothetical protein